LTFSKKIIKTFYFLTQTPNKQTNNSDQNPNSPANHLMCEKIKFNFFTENGFKIFLKILKTSNLERRLAHYIFGTIVNVLGYSGKDEEYEYQCLVDVLDQNGNYENKKNLVKILPKIKKLSNDEE
jgi:hypothetical protein